MTGDQRPILVPLDGSELAERALPWAVLLAERLGAPLLLARVIPFHFAGVVSLSAVAFAPVTSDVEQAEAAAYLEAHAQALRRLYPQVQVATEVRMGGPAFELLNLERSVGARLVALTTHGRSGLARWMRGSVAEEVVRHGTAPVVLVRPWDEPDGPRAARRPEGSGLRVLVPLDGSPAAAEVLPLAAALARGEGGMLSLVTVIRPDTEREIGPHYAPRTGQEREAAQRHLERVADGLRQGGLAAHVSVRIERDVAGEIAGLAGVEGADLVAMSTHGRGALGRMLYGSIADRVAHAAEVPVLLYRPEVALTQVQAQRAGDAGLAAARN